MIILQGGGSAVVIGDNAVGWKECCGDNAVGWRECCGDW